MLIANNKLFPIFLLMLTGVLIGYLSTQTPGILISLVLIGILFVLILLVRKRHIQAVVLSYLFITILAPKAGLKMGGLPLTVSNVFLCLSLLLSVVFYFSQRFKKTSTLETEYFIRKYLVGSLCFFLPFTALSIIEYGVQPTLISFIPNILPIFSLFFIYFFVSEKTTTILKIMIGASFLLVMYGTIQLIFGHYETAIPGLTVNYTDYAAGNVFESKNNMTALGLKLVSTYQNGNLYGSVLIFVSALMFGCMLTTTRKRTKLLYFMFLALSIVNLIAALSRSALIGFVISIIVMGFFVKKVRKYILLFTTLGIAYIFASGYSERIFANDSTGAGRLPQYETFWHSISNMNFVEQVRFFLIGKGFGFSYEFHNGYLLQQVESSLMNFVLYSGIIGVVIYTLPLFYIFWRLINWKKKNQQFVIAVSLFASLIGMLGQAAMDQLMNLPPTGQNYWIILSVLMIILREKESTLKVDTVKI